MAEIFKSYSTMLLKSNGGTMEVGQKATIVGYNQEVWFSSRAITNIISLSNLITQYVFIVVGLGRLLLFTPAIIGRLTLLSAFVALLILPLLFIVQILLQKRRSFRYSRLGHGIFAVFFQQVQSFLSSFGIPVVSRIKDILQILLEVRVLGSTLLQENVRNVPFFGVCMHNDLFCS